MMRVLYICTDWYRAEGSALSLAAMIEALRGQVQPVVLVAAEGEVAGLFRDMGIEVLVEPFFYLWEKPKPLLTVLHHPRRTALYRSLTLNRHCCRAVQRAVGRVDLVHTNTSVVTIGAMLARRMGVPHVWHVRESLDALGIRPYGGMRRLLRQMRRAEACILISEALRDCWPLPPQRVAVVHDAIYASLPPMPRGERAAEVLFCAAELNDYKGAREAVEIFCQAALSGYRLVMVGHAAPGYQQSLLAIAAEHGCAEALTFVGYCADVHPHYRRAAALLCCSRFEGLGRVCLEAMAEGCVVVARRAGGVEDYLHHQRTGYLYNTLAEGAKSLRQAMAKPEAVVYAARAEVAREYTAEACAKGVMAVYQRCTT